MLLTPDSAQNRPPHQRIVWCQMPVMPRLRKSKEQREGLSHAEGGPEPELWKWPRHFKGKKFPDMDLKSLVFLQCSTFLHLPNSPTLPRNICMYRCLCEWLD